MLLCLRDPQSKMTKRGHQIGVCVREGNLIKGTWRKPDSRDSELLKAFVIITCGLNIVCVCAVFRSSASSSRVTRLEMTAGKTETCRCPSKLEESTWGW